MVTFIVRVSIPIDSEAVATGDEKRKTGQRDDLGKTSHGELLRCGESATLDAGFMRDGLTCSPVRSEPGRTSGGRESLGRGWVKRPLIDDSRFTFQADA